MPKDADMNKGYLGATGDRRTKRFYHGTRAELKPGDRIEPSSPLEVGERDAGHGRDHELAGALAGSAPSHERRP